MGYAKLDDGFWRNPKVGKLQDKAFRLYVRSISFSSLFNTDGVITSDDLKMLSGKPNIAEQLVEAGVWDRLEDGSWQVHDYTVHNTPKAERSSRGKHAANSRWGNSDVPADTASNAPGNASRMQPASTVHAGSIAPLHAYTDTDTKADADTKTDTKQSVGHLPDPSLAVICRAVEQAGIPLSEKLSEQVQHRLDEGTPVAWFLDALEITTTKRQTWGYTLGILKNWAETGKPLAGHQQINARPSGMRGLSLDDPNYVGPDLATIQRLVEAGEL